MTTARPTASVRYDNTDRVVIVTGGSSGIGECIVQRFAASGAKVVCADIQQPAELPEGAIFVNCDVADRSQCQNVAAKTLEHFGGIDVLVNNASIQLKEAYRPVDELTEETWHKMVGVNFSGYHWMATSVLPHMRSQERGVIVNIASGQAHRTAREVGVYGPIKSANIMQARQWAVEYARQGIRVVSVSPGAIDTPLVRGSLEEQGGEEALANRHPLGRIGRVQEVANAVLWLSSDDASFITGTDLEVDGGLGAFGAFADPY